LQRVQASVDISGLAGINVIANLVGGGAVSLVGLIEESSGSFSIALLPIAALTSVGGISVLVITRQPSVGTVAAASAT
jgi:hypothetical protein